MHARFTFGYFPSRAATNKLTIELLQIILEATRGEDHRSDIAIDDVTIRMGLCDVPTDCDFDSFDSCGYKAGNFNYS